MQSADLSAHHAAHVHHAEYFWLIKQLIIKLRICSGTMTTVMTDVIGATAQYDQTIATAYT